MNRLSASDVGGWHRRRSTCLSDRCIIYSSVGTMITASEKLRNHFTVKPGPHKAGKLTEQIISVKVNVKILGLHQR